MESASDPLLEDEATRSAFDEVDEDGEDDEDDEDSEDESWVGDGRTVG